VETYDVVPSVGLLSPVLVIPAAARPPGVFREGALRAGRLIRLHLYDFVKRAAEGVDPVLGQLVILELCP